MSRKTKLTYVWHSHSFYQCSFLCRYICCRQSRKALGRLHRADRGSFHKDSGKGETVSGN